jgi:hypothetical protein
MRSSIIIIISFRRLLPFSLSRRHKNFSKLFYVFRFWRQIEKRFFGAKYQERKSPEFRIRTLATEGEYANKTQPTLK